MKVSFEGVGESVVTFYNSQSAGAAAGAPVRLSGNGEVSACADGERFFGVALACDEGFAAVQNGGYALLSYSGTAPVVGHGRFSADGSGGVKVDEAGGEFLVVDVDTAGSKVGLML